MLVTFAQIKELANQIDPSDYDFEYVGIRVQEGTRNAKIGKTLKHRSNLWVDGNMKRTKLNGVSAVFVPRDYFYKIGAFEHGGYHGDTILILGCNTYEYGEDENEIVMIDPVVIDIRRA